MSLGHSNTEADMHTGHWPRLCEHEGRNQGDESTSQRMPRIANKSSENGKPEFNTLLTALSRNQAC